MYDLKKKTESRYYFEVKRWTVHDISMHTAIPALTLNRWKKAENWKRKQTRKTIPGRRVLSATEIGRFSRKTWVEGEPGHEKRHRFPKGIKATK